MIPFVHMESAAYLFNAIDGRPALAHVFDVQRNDFGLYQARELSYAVDWLDALAVAVVFKGTGFFLAVSWWHVLAVATIAGVSAFALRAGMPRLDAVAALLPAMLLATSPSVLLATRHFRTAKALAAVALFTLALALARRQSPRLIFLLALVLVLADRQGTFFVVGLGLLIATSRAARPAILALLLAVASGIIYNLFIGPVLIRTFAEQDVNWALQSGTLNLSQLPSADAWRGGAVWLFDSIGLLAGSLGVAWGVVVAAIATGCAWRVGGRGWGLRVLGTLGALLGLGVLMKVNHPPIDAPDVRIGYYNLPLHALMVVGVVLLLERTAASESWPRIRRSLIIAMAALAAMNLIATPRLATRVRGGADAPDLAVSAALTQCIERGGDEAAEQALMVEAAKVGWGARYTRLCARYRTLGSGSR